MNHELEGVWSKSQKMASKTQKCIKSTNVSQITESFFRWFHLIKWSNAYLYDYTHDKWCNSATEAEKKQNWLENRLGNMVKEEGDAEDLNKAAEVVRYESYSWVIQMT